MIRAKLGLLGLCVMMGVLVTSVSAAHGSTLSWLILNSTHTTATELKATLAVKTDSQHLTLDGEVAGLKIALTCTNLALKGVNLELGGKLTEGGKIIFTGCKIYRTAPLTEEYKCTAKTSGAAAGTIETGELKGELTLVGTELVTKIEPKAGPTGTFATLRFEGAECPLPELNQLHGTAFFKDCQSFQTTHKLEHLIESVSALVAIFTGGHSAKQLEVTKILGSFWVFLTGVHAGLEWSGMDV
jgi:hypothetical protein